MLTYMPWKWDETKPERDRGTEGTTYKETTLACVEVSVVDLIGFNDIDGWGFVMFIESHKSSGIIIFWEGAKQSDCNLSDESAYKWPRMTDRRLCRDSKNQFYYLWYTLSYFILILLTLMFNFFYRKRLCRRVV